MIMDWDLCERDFIRVVSRDEKRILAIIDKARIRLRRANGAIREEKGIFLVVEDYYEVIKELLVAYMLKNGLRSRNHQCLISYFLKKNNDKIREASLIQEMSHLRNRLNYYGEGISMKFYDRNKHEFNKIIDFLFELLEVKND